MIEVYESIRCSVTCAMLKKSRDFWVEITRHMYLRRRSIPIIEILSRV